MITKSHQPAWSAMGVCLVLAACSNVACSNKNDAPSRLSRFPDDLRNAQLDASGVYDDGWVGKSVSMNLKQPGSETVLRLRGMVPKIGKGDFQESVEIVVDGKVLDSRSLNLGEFEIIEPVDARAGMRRIALSFSRTLELPGGDGRAVAARIMYIGLERAGSATDVVHGVGLRLGSNWGPFEKFGSDTFRWVDNDAELTIAADKSGESVLSLIVEPGPGVGGPFLLKVLDASRKQVAAAEVDRRQIFKAILPVETGSANSFLLHVDEGGKKTANDPRVLNFRVFRIEAMPMAGH